MNQNYITVLHPNDVISGRGPIPAAYEGNKRFRVLIRRHRKSYTSGNRFEKQKLGSDILNQIHAVRGRFLKQVDPALAVDAYYEVSEKVALAKIKQALREHRTDSWWNDGASSEIHAKEGNVKRSHHKKGKARPLPLARKQIDDLVTNEHTGHLSDGYTPTLVSHIETTTTQALCPDTPTPIYATIDDGSSMSPVVTPNVAVNTSSPLKMLPPLVPREAESNTGMTAFDTRPLLFRDQLFVPQQQAITSWSFATRASQPSEIVQFSSSWDFSSVPSEGIARCNVENKRKNTTIDSEEDPIEQASIDSFLQDFSLSQAPPSVSETATADSISSSAFNETPKSTEKKLLTGGASKEMSEEDVAAFLLNSLALVDRPVVTEEDEALERSLLSTAERAALLSDALGISSERNIPFLCKRQKTNYDRKTTAYLVGLMKIEIEKIPPKLRRALVKAQMNCGINEFNDSRLEQFLKAEGMNSKLAALRFVRYWESRKEVFGEEKYLEKMNLSGALRDDLAALQSGVFFLLEPDASGRYILFVNVARHSLDEYTSDSLLRAVWYLVEVAARDKKNTGIVQILWFKGATIWDYDLRVYDRLAYMMSNCFPIRFKANHLCCPPRVARLIKPIIHSFMSKDMRIHTIQHDVPENEIIEVLSNYGIYRNMLPTDMGGTVKLDLDEFVANRFATELEELY